STRATGPAAGPYCFHPKGFGVSSGSTNWFTSTFSATISSRVRGIEDCLQADARLGNVVRFALAVVVALLTFSTSGVSALLVPEPCSAFEPPGQEDGACPPTCVRCACCARAAETVIPPLEGSLEITVAD